jgi:hypothetical protein
MSFPPPFPRSLPFFPFPFPLLPFFCSTCPLTSRHPVDSFLHPGPPFGSSKYPPTPAQKSPKRKIQHPIWRPPTSVPGGSKSSLHVNSSRVNPSVILYFFIFISPSSCCCSPLLPHPNSIPPRNKNSKCRKKQNTFFWAA